MNRLMIWVCKFIPTHISNRVLLLCLQIMRRLQRHGDIFAISHANQAFEYGDAAGLQPEILVSEKQTMSQQQLSLAESFVDNQHAMSNLFLGMSTMAEAGCEVIATYNALVNIGKKQPLSTLIGLFERDGIIHGGKFGVAPKAIADNLARLGVETRTFVPSKKNSDIDSFSHEFNTLIITYYNDCTDLMKQIHTVAVTADSAGYTAHNAFCNGAIPAPKASVTELIASITQGKGKPIVLFGIGNK